MLAAGATAEVIVAAVEADAAETERVAADRRAKAAERKRDYRARHAVSPNVPGTGGDIASVPGTTLETRVSPTPPSETQSHTPPSAPKGASSPKPKSRPLRQLPDDWAPSAEQRVRWKGRGATDALLDSSAEDMRTWARGKGISRADWAATYDGFVKRDLAAGGKDLPMGQSRGPPTPNHRPMNGFAAVHRAALDHLATNGNEPQSHDDDFTGQTLDLEPGGKPAVEVSPQRFGGPLWRAGSAGRA